MDTLIRITNTEQITLDFADVTGISCILDPGDHADLYVDPETLKHLQALEASSYINIEHLAPPQITRVELLTP